MTAVTGLAANAIPAVESAPPHDLCSGRVWHVRQQPFRHDFDYRVHMLLLDLDHLDTAFAGHRLWSLERFNVGSFRPSDHLGGASADPDRGATLGDRVRSFVSERLGFQPRGSVKLLTNPRYLGFGFNPVTFYFALREGGNDLDAILLEVANTPWNERHVYALDCRGRTSPLSFEVAKDFHVSPFLPMDMRYRFRFVWSPERFEVVKENWRDGERMFSARMELSRAPLTQAALGRALSGLPMTFKVVAAIYWQALRLWLKGAVYHPRPPEHAGPRD